MASGPPAGQQIAPYYVRDIEWYHTTADIKKAIMDLRRRGYRLGESIPPRSKASGACAE